MIVSLSTFVWISVIVALVVIRLVWKGISRGVFIAIIIATLLWLLRMFMPEMWNSFIVFIQSLISKLLN